MEASQKSLFQTTRKFTFKSIKYLLLTTIGLSIINIVFFILSIFIFQSIDEVYIYIISIAVIFILGLFFTILGVYITYKSILIDALHEVYKQMSPYFRKLCDKVVGKIGITPQSTSEDCNLIDKKFNIVDVLKTNYNQNIPKLFQKAIGFVVKRIPFVPILADVMNSRKYSTQEEINDCFYQQVDLYIQDSIFASNDMKWLYWYIPINIIVQTICLYLLISSF